MKTAFSEKFHRLRSRAGYTLAEVLVASALVGLAMGGAVALSATMNMQIEGARGTAIALNLQDCAARLWQLGLSASECDAILPAVTDNERLARAVTPSSVNCTTWGAANNVTLPNSMGVVEEIDNTVTLRNIVGGTDRTNVIPVYRPTIR